jgi:hypothetical protein
VDWNETIVKGMIAMGTWTSWKRFPAPAELKHIEVSDGPGVYQLRNIATRELILFGIGGSLQERMKSLMPQPFGSGTRKNSSKREYVLEHYSEIEYRIYETTTREEAARMERILKQEGAHIFNT